ncbi:MAG TPA: hypothetical protein VFG91_01075 [Woeseiaceae bacterium]|nr:hypothetical protein [Woeseiaceae bacterium]
MNKLLALSSALLLSGQAIADDDSYLVRCVLSDGDRVLGSPAVVVESGQKATVSVSDTYSLSLVAEPQDDGRIQLSADIQLQGESHSPVLLVKPDQETAVQIGDTSFSVTVSHYVPDR